MKLVFPNGEHEPVVLRGTPVRIGSAADCDVRIGAPGVAAHHCEISIHDGHASVRPLEATAPTILNGRQVRGDTPLAVSDLLVLGRVGCSLVAEQPASAAPPGRRQPLPAGQTVVRMTMPKFLLRGVSGTTFGKTFTLSGNMTVGRQADCDISISSDEVSRRHARLTVQSDGVLVEDLGSANGTFINDRRIHTDVLRAGDELRLDTVRFLLTTPGAEMASAPPREAEPAEPRRGHAALWIGLVVVLGAVAIAWVALRYLGMI
jgi:pSer/pThr/pTyr-binding forkhead associated (FHA) protein